MISAVWVMFVDLDVSSSAFTWKPVAATCCNLSAVGSVSAVVCMPASNKGAWLNKVWYVVLYQALVTDLTVLATSNCTDPMVPLPGSQAM